MKYNTSDNSGWESLSPEEKKRQLYLQQRQTLDLFLERNAITREQYDKSLRDMTERMGYSAEPVS